MKTAIFISVRTNSSRLPKKALLEIKSKKTIEYVIERAKQTIADEVILCTTFLEEDKVLCELAKRWNIKYFCGSIEDKLQRWNDAAEAYNVDFFVTFDGDDLFCEPLLANKAITQYVATGCDYIKGEDSLIVGSFTNGISIRSLRQVCKIKNTSDTEMIWPYFTDTSLFSVSVLKDVEDVYKNKELRLTLDYQEDFLFFSRVVEEIKQESFSLIDVINLCEERPEIPRINWHLMNKWKQNQVNNTKLCLK